ncbi:MAG: FHA domain-containing protein, partial [Gemmatimonadaceae bacterium]
MPIELRILSGARAGHSESFEKSVIAVGRHPMSDFRFDPKQDLDVSTRHGEIRCVDGRYSVLDSNSRNGTFVNGQRVTPGGSRELRDSDVIAFGAHGPTVSVTLPGLVSMPADAKVPAASPPAGVAAQSAASPGPAAAQPASPPRPQGAPPAAKAPPNASPAPSARPAAPKTPPSPTVERPSGSVKPRRNTAERVAIAV